MTIVIHDAAIVTVDAADRVIYGGALAIEGGRIAAVGASPEILARYPGAERIDASGKAVMPGFANVHTHLELTIARGVYEDLSPPHKPPFDGGLAPIPVPDLNDDERRVMCELGALEAMRSGTTAIVEDSTRIDRYADAPASGLNAIPDRRGGIVRYRKAAHIEWAKRDRTGHRQVQALDAAQRAA